MVKNGVDATTVEGMREPYEVPMKLTVHHPKQNVPVLWWRSVGSTHTAYVMETLVDEIAVATKQDPVAYRLKLMGEDPKHARHRAALQLAVDKSGYGRRKLPKGVAWGVAVHESFESVVAYVVEATVVGQGRNARPRLLRATAGVHCNLCVNPRTVEAQVQGAAMMGLATTLPGHAITLKDGVVEQGNFHQYTPARIGDAPVVLLVTGIMLFHLIWQLTLAGSFGLLDEVWSRNLLNLIATPLTEREMLSSFGIVGLLRTAVSVTVIGAVGVVFFAVSPISAGVVLVPSAALLLLFGWSVALFVVGLTLQYGDRAEVFSWGTLVLLMPLSGVFYPVESLPPVLQAVARAIPLTHVFDAVRIGIEDGEVAWAQLAVAAAGTAVIAAASTWFVAHQLRRFRRDGWVTRFV